MTEIKRLNYYSHQFLVESDFKDEQSYHIDMRRRHNRTMHGWGIAEGLLVERTDDHEILVTPGTAVDKDGREIVLTAGQTLKVLPPEQAGPVYLVATYREESIAQHSSSGVAGFTRTKESPVLSFLPQLPPDEGIALARVHLDEAGKILRIDHSVRHPSGALLQPGMIQTDLLAEDSVTVSKLAPNLKRQHGWVRMSFKPLAFHERTPFRIGPTEARSEKQGSAGTMGIPAPPGADRVTGFRIAGEWNDGEIKFVLWRTGWSSDKLQHERMPVLEDVIKARPVYRKREGVDREINPFEEEYELPRDDRFDKLNLEYDALALLVETTREASISLVAVRFEYDLRDYERRQLRSGRR